MLSDAQRKQSQRERTAKHREKMKERSANDVLANEQKRKDDFDSWRTRLRLVFPGEIEAHINAESVRAGLQVAREFLLALGESDVRLGESLLNVERRVVSAWNELGCPLLNRNSLRLEMSVASNDGFALDFDKWIPIAGAHDLIDITTLPVIEIPEAVPAVDTPATNRADDPALKKYPSEEVAALCKITQAAIDADARRICANNLERELRRERREGAAYVPASKINFGTRR